MADLQRTVYPHKWSPVSCRSSIGQGKFAGQRPTFYHCATQPTQVKTVNKNKTPRAKYRLQSHTAWQSQVLNSSRRLFSCLQNCQYVTPGTLSDGGSRLQIRAVVQRKYRSPKRVDMRWTRSVGMSDDLSWCCDQQTVINQVRR